MQGAVAIRGEGLYEGLDWCGQASTLYSCVCQTSSCGIRSCGWRSWIDKHRKPSTAPNPTA